jgi:V/A-type H+-transporting ATPase subunit I
MFTPTQMRRVNIFLAHDDVEEATVSLAGLRSLHLGTDDGDEWSPEPGAWGELVDTHIDHRRRAERLLHALDLDVPADKPAEAAEPSEHAEGLERALSEAEDEILSLSDELGDVASTIDHLRVVIHEVEMLAPVDLPLEEIRNPRFLRWVVGTMPREHVERLEVILFRIPVVIVPIDLDNDRVLLVAAASRDHGDILERAMRGVFVQPVSLPEGIGGVPADALAELHERLEEREGRRDALLTQKERLRDRWAHRLSGLWRMAQSSLRIATALTRFDQHGSVYLISGWIPQEEVDELLIAMESTTEGRADVELADPGTSARAQTPTKLRNPRFLKPFETLVSTFGFPGYRESDPTFVVAVTFVLMYGMMFGDVGHGLIVAILGGLLAANSSGTARSVGTILAVSGVSGIAFGFLYGSVMGSEQIISALWLSPLHDITSILTASVIGGIVVLNLGFLFNILTAAGTRDWRRFLLDPHGLTGLALYWALVGGGYAAFQGAIGVPLFLLFVLIPAALLLLAEPLSRLVSGTRPLLEEGVGTYAVRAFFELFENVISNLSNTLSFVRLGAFAVAHAGLMSVVFSLADMGGTVARWIIISVGTVIVIGLEGLVVAIQALRLEYYEFFGKFFSGEGVPYRPFGLDGKRGS